MFIPYENIAQARADGWYNNWQIVSFGLIQFFIHPQSSIDEHWREKRALIYQENASRLRVSAVPVDYYVYPTRDFGQERYAIMACVAYISRREIHGHPNQSPGHELTHVLQGQLPHYKHNYFPALWFEGMAVFLDGTRSVTPRDRARAVGHNESILATSWSEWHSRVPDDCYPLVGSIIQFCDEIFGWSKVLDFIQELLIQQGNDSTAAQKIFEQSLDELNHQWRQWLRA